MGLLRVLYYCILRPLWYCIIKPLCGCCFPDCYPETLETGLKKSPYRLHGYIHEMATDEDGVFYKDPTAAKEMLCNELTAAIEISFASTNEIVPEASLDEQKKILELLYTTDAVFCTSHEVIGEDMTVDLDKITSQYSWQQLCDISKHSYTNSIKWTLADQRFRTELAKNVNRNLTPTQIELIIENGRYVGTVIDHFVAHGVCFRNYICSNAKGYMVIYGKDAAQLFVTATCFKFKQTVLNVEPILGGCCVLCGFGDPQPLLSLEEDELIDLSPPAIVTAPKIVEMTQRKRRRSSRELIAEHFEEEKQVVATPVSPITSVVSQPQPQPQPQLINVTIPSGAVAGQTLQIQTLTGEKINVAIPPNMKAGMNFQVKYVLPPTKQMPIEEKKNIATPVTPVVQQSQLINETDTIRRTNNNDDGDDDDISTSQTVKIQIEEKQEKQVVALTDANNNSAMSPITKTVDTNNDTCNDAIKTQVVNQADEMNKIKDFMSTFQSKVSTTDPGNCKETVIEIKSELAIWFADNKIKGASDALQMLNEIGVIQVQDLIDLDEDDIENVGSTLKKIPFKKFMRILKSMQDVSAEI